MGRPNRARRASGSAPPPRPPWRATTNVAPASSLARVVKSRTADGAAVTPWGASVDAWLASRGFSILRALSRREADEIEEVFAQLDDDDSGALDANELLDAFEREGEGVDVDALRALIASVDFDGSGLLELDEFFVIAGGRDERRHGEKEKPGAAALAPPSLGVAFDSTWARGVRRRKALDAACEGGARRARLIRLAAERRAEAARRDAEAAATREAAVAAASPARLADDAAREAEALRRAGPSRAIELELALAVTRRARREGLPPVSLARARDAGSGDAAVRSVVDAVARHAAAARGKKKKRPPTDATAPSPGDRGRGSRDRANDKEEGCLANARRLSPHVAEQNAYSNAFERVAKASTDRGERGAGATDKKKPFESRVDGVAAAFAGSELLRGVPAECLEAATRACRAFESRRRRGERVATRG